MKTSKLSFGSSSDELAVEIMLWLNQHPNAQGEQTLFEAMRKLGYEVTTIDTEALNDY